MTKPYDQDDPLAGLDFDVTIPEVVDVTKLNRLELGQLWDHTRNELLDSRQMHAPPEERTERGKELHSIFIAVNLERMNRRQ